MEIRLRVAAADQQEAVRLTQDLGGWLAEDRDVGLYAEVRRQTVRGTEDRGAMSGALVEWISLVTTSGFSAVNLAYAHRSFRMSQPRSRRTVPVVIEVGQVRIEVEDGSPETTARIVRALEAGGDQALPDAGAADTAGAQDPGHGGAP